MQVRSSRILAVVEVEFDLFRSAPIEKGFGVVDFLACGLPHCSVRIKSKRQTF